MQTRESVAGGTQRGGGGGEGAGEGSDEGGAWKHGDSENECLLVHWLIE